MNYDIGKLLSEQSSTTMSLVQAQKEYLLSPTDETKTKSIELQNQLKQNLKWPQYCSPDPAIWSKAIQISRTVNGSKLGPSESMSPNTCAYKAPTESENMGQTFVELPRDIKITFWDDDKITEFLYSYQKKHKKNSSINLPLTKSIFDKFVKDTPATIFYINKTFSPWFQFNRENQTLKFLGWWYGRSEGVSGEKLKQVIWQDPRNSWQTFVDEHQFLMMAGSIVLAIVLAHVLPGTAPWVIELIVEGVTGGLIGYRDLQKGDNISAAMGFLFMCLPLWKPAFANLRGVNNSVLRNLGKKIANVGLKTADDYVIYIETLTKPEKEILSKILYDENAWYVIEQELKGFTDPKKVEEYLKFIRETYPDLIKTKSLIKRVWFQDISLTALLMGVTIYLEVTMGEKWNDIEKEKFSKLYQDIPKQMQEQFTQMYLENPNVVLPEHGTSEYQKLIQSKDEESFNRGFNELMGKTEHNKNPESEENNTDVTKK